VWSSNPELPLLLRGDDPLDAFRGWCAAHRGARCRLWLGGALTLPLVLDPGLPLADDAAMRDHVRRIFVHVGQAGAAGAAVAGWRSGPRLGAVMLTGVDLAALQLAAREHGVRLVSARPWWSLALVNARRRAPAVARGRARLLVVEGRSVTAITLQGGHIEALRQHWLAAPTWVELLAAAVDDGPVWAIGDGLVGSADLAGPVQMLGALDGGPDELLGSQVPVPAVPDFLAADTARSQAPGWALAATAALVLGVAGLDAQQVWQARQATRDAALAPVSTAPTLVPDPERAARLRHPWPQVFAATEAAAGGSVQWLALDHDAGRPDVRLAGTAADLPDALAAADRLARSAGIAEARLAHSEVGASAVAFELQAQLADVPLSR
jgi:hypothetical protein